MALNIKTNLGATVKVPSMKEVDDRILSRIGGSTLTFKTINSTAITGTGNFALEPSITAGTASQYWGGTKQWQSPDTTPTSASTQLITSGAVYTAIENIIDGNTPVTYDASIIDDSTNTKAPLTQAVYDDVVVPFNNHKNDTAAHISPSERSAWNGKQDLLVSGTNIKTINNTTLLGSGNIDLQTPLTTYTANTVNLYKIATNGLGQVINATAAVKGDITNLGIPAQDTTYNAVVAGSSTDGLMTGADKAKLDSIEADGQENVIESISINGTAQTITNKNVNLPAYPTVSNATITIDSSHTTTQTAGADTFTLNGTAVTIDFHEIAKTGDYDDLLNKPNLGLKADKVTGATSGNFAGLDNSGNLTDSGKKASDFADADDLEDHMDDQANPHIVTLSQAATAQGTTLTVVPAAGIYEGSDTSGSGKSTKYQTKTEVDNAISIAVQGGSKYLGQLKFGATTKTDMAALTLVNAPTLVDNDLCYNEETQKIYKYVTGTATADDVPSVTSGKIWQLQPVTGTEAVGEYYDIVFWYGNWDNVQYVGEVPGTVTISNLNDPLNPTWDLIVYSSAVPDGVVTDAKIGTRSVNDTSVAPSNDNSAKELTPWLQQFYSNIKYLNASKANMVSSATAGNFPVLTAGGDLANSAFNSNSFIASTALNTGTLSTTSTTTVPSEKTVADAIGNGQLSILLAPADGGTATTVNFTANQSGNASVTISVPSSFTPVETDWTT
jgi:hypothetical protein